jgi:hypothetical protein
LAFLARLVSILLRLGLQAEPNLAGRARRREWMRPPALLAAWVVGIGLVAVREESAAQRAALQDGTVLAYLVRHLECPLLRHGPAVLTGRATGRLTVTAQLRMPLVSPDHHHPVRLDAAEALYQLPRPARAAHALLQHTDAHAVSARNRPFDAVPALQLHAIRQHHRHVCRSSHIRRSTARTV